VTSTPPAIESLIPHRAPFRLVDAVVEIDGEQGEMELRLARDDPRLRGGRLQALYLIEALAQAAAALNGALHPDADERGMLVEVARARFLGDACAGDTVRLCVRREQAFGAMHRLSGTAIVGGRLLAETALTVLRTAGETP
jgi:3-hydroxymyristoyl/3-hydroxydecanoyl-(acyl carrier protein) dehydratase